MVADYATEDTLQEATQHLQLLKAELTEDQFLRAQAVLTSVRDGASLEDACEAADITRRTWYNWMDKHPLLKRIVSNIRNSRVATCKGILYECALQARTNPRFQPSLFFLLERESREEYGNRYTYVDDTEAAAIAKAMTDEQLAKHITEAAIALTKRSSQAVGHLVAGSGAQVAAEPVEAGAGSRGEAHP